MKKSPVSSDLAEVSACRSDASNCVESTNTCGPVSPLLLREAQEIHLAAGSNESVTHHGQSLTNLRCPVCREQLLLVSLCPAEDCFARFYFCNSDSATGEKGVTYAYVSRTAAQNILRFQQTGQVPPELKRVPTSRLTPEAFHAKYRSDGVTILREVTGDARQMRELRKDVKALTAHLAELSKLL